MSVPETVEDIVAEFSADRTAYLVRSLDEPQTRRGWGPWVIEGNIKPDPRPGSDHKPPRRGTRKLRGGAKVYFVGAYWGGNRVIVVGHHRMAGDYVMSAIRVEMLIQLRPKVLYSPGVARTICRAFVRHPKRALSVPHTDCFFENRPDADKTIEKIQANIDHHLRLRSERSERRPPASRDENESAASKTY